MEKWFEVNINGRPKKVVLVAIGTYDGRPKNVLIYFTKIQFLDPSELGEYIEVLGEAKALAEQWQEEYNQRLAQSKIKIGG